MYGRSDLLSPLYARLARTGDLRTDLSSFFTQGFLKARDTALADAGFLFLNESLQERSMMTASCSTVKETKAQRTERLKRAKNPWDAFDEVRAVRTRRPLERRARVGRGRTSSGGASTRRAMA